MTRFLMSLDESVDLVEYAFDHAEPGDLFVRKAPACTVERPRPGRRVAVRRRRPGDPGHRHPARREALRVAAEPRGAAEGRRPRRLLPRAAGRAVPGVRAVLRRGRARRGRPRLHLAQHRAARRRRGQALLLHAPADPARAGRAGRRPEGACVKVAITGGYGFLGWHTACRLRALHGVEPVRLGRRRLRRPAAARRGAARRRRGHPPRRRQPRRDRRGGRAGQRRARRRAGRRRSRAPGRPSTWSTPTRSRPSSTTPTAGARPRPPRSSAAAVAAAGGHFADLLLPNLFGEHGRPGYNSFVATFAHEVAAGRTPDRHRRPRDPAAARPGRGARR